MSAQEKAQALGIEFPEQQPGYLNLCAKTGNLLITSGHVSDQKGKLGDDVTVEQGYEAAKDCAIKILQSVHNTHGTIDGLKVIKLLGCVNSTLDFTDQHLVINGASQLVRDVFGEEGRHARTAIGMAQLPLGSSVEVEMILRKTS